MRRIHIASLFALSGLALLSSCDIQAQAKERSYGLAEEYRFDKSNTIFLEDLPEGTDAPLMGALEMLCGTPAEPQLMLLEDWVDEGYDPNFPEYPVGDMGSGEISEDEMALIEEDNMRVFAVQLEAIAEGDYAGVVPFRGAPVLQAKWDDFLADALEDEDGDGAPDFVVEEDDSPNYVAVDSEELFREEAAMLLIGWYPRLVDSADLYRLECMHCHGNEGAGDGSTAPFLHPAPRNYQPGWFKWAAVENKAKPRRVDLYNILSEGAYTSAMPNFKRFSRAQLHGLVDYVRLLSIRGETERMLVLELDGGASLTPALISETYSDIWEQWNNADERVVHCEGDVPEPTAELLARGRELYMDANGGNCYSCHGDLGLGDGASAWEEVDGVSQRIVDDWGEEIIPRNLTSGIYRGGRRPIDIYRRISIGITGTPMPAVPDTLTEEDRWAIVHYVLSLSDVHDGVGLDSMRMRAAHADHSDEDHDSEGH
ncbi:MAG: cytochrome c [Planctomycetes bacterium]|nr:cytochrome c [Planctomycetota bacterium]